MKLDALPLIHQTFPRGLRGLLEGLQLRAGRELQKRHEASSRDPAQLSRVWIRYPEILARAARDDVEVPLLYRSAIY
jgi:hypothetical protein